MEIIDLRFQAREVPAHSNVASLVISLSSIPALDSHAIQSGERTSAICAATAVEKDGVVLTIVQQLKILGDGAWRNLRPGTDFFDRNSNVLHAELLDDRLFRIVFGA